MLSKNIAEPLFSLHLLKTIYYGKKSRRKENGKKRTVKNGQRKERRKTRKEKQSEKRLNRKTLSRLIALKGFFFYLKKIKNKLSEITNYLWTRQRTDKVKLC